MADRGERPGDSASRREADRGAITRSSPGPRPARRDRGAETRLRLIEAGLDVFGRYGFDGAATRHIASAANANLAAIAYHFGSKEALHVAVAEHIVAAVGARVGPSLAAAADPAAMASPAAARAMLIKLVESYISVILGSAEAERWARFLLREQMQPTAAFDVLYGYMGNSLAAAGRLIGRALDRAPDDEDVKLRAITLFGQVIVFRLAQALVLRRMGWQAIDDAQRAAIADVVTSQINAILDRESRR